MPYRECSACHLELWDDEFSNTQWNKGVGYSRCFDCVRGGIFDKPESSESSSDDEIYRVCGACEMDLPSNSYSSNQWYSKGVGTSRCQTCVREGYHSTADMKDSARRNDAFDCTYERGIYARGTFRNVRLGRYTRGRRTGQQCVAKFFRNTRDINVDEYFDADEAVTTKTIEFLSSWNSRHIVSKPIRVNRPDVWTNEAGMRYTVEPFIDGFQKFNSNTGWTVGGDSWADVMQALSHYTYHITSGHFVLCDLQGGIYDDGAVLTDPVILSRQAGRFGPMDLGSDGIESFFRHHTCTRFCSRSWCRPRAGTGGVRFRAVQGTTMHFVSRRY